MNFYDKRIEDVMKHFNVDESGLTEEEVVKRIDKYGLNEIKEKKRKSNILKFLEQFNDMMIIILIIVDVLMFIYGLSYSKDFTDSIVITVVVFINALMGFIQELKAEVTLDGLKKYSTTNCKVLRDGSYKIIDSKQLVPGDIILLEAGDRIPADARIISECNLSVDESPLTGEAIPVKKINTKLSGNLQIQDQLNMLFCGCNVVNGNGAAIVVKTGMDTELGEIAVSLNTPYKVETPLQLKIKELSKKLTLIIFFIIIFIFVYGSLSGYKVMEIIMLCVSLAVAVIPEGLPAVITIALSNGVGVLARKKTVVRQMSAVETLGATDIICSDKTGTITQNKMSVKESFIYDKTMFNYCATLCNDFFYDNKNIVGDPTETSLIEFVKCKSFDPIKIKNKYPRIDGIPFDSNRKLMTSINEIDNKLYVLTKGSLEHLIGHCDYIIKDGKKVKLEKKVINEIKKLENNYAKEALRVIAFAYKEIKNIPSNKESIEEKLIFVGLVGIIDPPRDSVKDSVLKCIKAGIKPVMITGDSLITASAIAREVGILKDDSEAIMGSDLDKYSDEELKSVVKSISVYARVTPEHKRRIVKAWQDSGKVVAMTGDGVNDAPAIKDAHVGVGMGITGTEVTKSVADVILLDDSFSTIVVAVEEGRRIFNNIKSNIVYALSSNFAELFVVLVGLFTKTTILLPIHILFIDLVTDSVPSICLSFEKSENDIMEKEPRGIDKPIFTRFVMANIILSSILEAIFVLIPYYIVLKNYNIEYACTVALFTMVLQEIVYSYCCRNLKKSILKQGIFSNKYFTIGIILLIFFEAAVFLTPIGSLLNISRLPNKLMIMLVIYNMVSFWIYELFKPILVKLYKD